MADNKQKTGEFSCSISYSNDNLKQIKGLNTNFLGSPSAELQLDDPTNSGYVSTIVREGGGVTSDASLACANYTGTGSGFFESRNLGIALRHITPPVGEVTQLNDDILSDSRIPFNQLSSLPADGEITLNSHIVNGLNVDTAQFRSLSGLNLNFSADGIANKTYDKAHEVSGYGEGQGNIDIDFENLGTAIQDALHTSDDPNRFSNASFSKKDREVTGSLDGAAGFSYLPNDRIRLDAGFGATLGVDDRAAFVEGSMTVSNEAKNAPLLYQNGPVETVKRFDVHPSTAPNAYATIGAQSFYVDKSRFDVPIVANYQDGTSESFQGDLNHNVNRVYAEIGVKDMPIAKTGACADVALNTSSTDKGITDGSTDGHSLTSLTLSVGGCPKMSFEEVQEASSPLQNADQAQPIRDGVPIK